MVMVSVPGEIPWDIKQTEETLKTSGVDYSELGHFISGLSSQDIIQKFEIALPDDPAMATRLAYHMSRHPDPYVRGSVASRLEDVIIRSHGERLPTIKEARFAGRIIRQLTTDSDEEVRVPAEEAIRYIASQDSYASP